MKKLAGLYAVLLILALCAGVCAACAEGAETVTFKKLTVSVDVEELDLGSVTVGQDDFKKFYQFLDKLPNLKRVDMYKTRMIRRRCEEMTERYPNIEFGWTLHFNNHTCRTDATAFSTRHGSESARHKSIDLSILKYCHRLVALDIGHNEVTTVNFLREMPQLKILIIADNKLNDIEPIGTLTNLEYLELFVNNVHDITPLANLTNLIDLNICYNRIKDLSPLYGLTNLRRLWIYNSNDYNPTHPLDPAAVQALQEALPDTYIDSTHMSVYGGWRKHPRYECIRRIFAEGGEYEPFPPEETPWRPGGQEEEEREDAGE